MMDNMEAMIHVLKAMANADNKFNLGDFQAIKVISDALDPDNEKSMDDVMEAWTEFLAKNSS